MACQSRRSHDGSQRRVSSSCSFSQLTGSASQWLSVPRCEATVPSQHGSGNQCFQASGTAGHRRPRPCDLVVPITSQIFVSVLHDPRSSPRQDNLSPQSIVGSIVGSQVPRTIQAPAALGGGNRARGRPHDDATPGPIKGAKASTAPLGKNPLGPVPTSSVKEVHCRPRQGNDLPATLRLPATWLHGYATVVDRPDTCTTSGWSGTNYLQVFVSHRP